MPQSPELPVSVLTDSINQIPFSASNAWVAGSVTFAKGFHILWWQYSYFSSLPQKGGRISAVVFQTSDTESVTAITLTVQV